MVLVHDRFNLCYRQILGSRSMGIGSKLVLVALIIGATVGLPIDRGYTVERQQTFSKRSGKPLKSWWRNAGTADGSLVRDKSLRTRK